MRKRSFADAADGYFKLGNQLKQRDVQGVRKTLSGMSNCSFQMATTASRTSRMSSSMR